MKTIHSHPSLRSFPRFVFSRLRPCSVLGLISVALPSAAQAFWINEFHYDNSGTDIGEFVEIVAPSDFTALATVRLTLYNGGDGAPYGTSHLLSGFTAGASASGLTVYSKFIGGLQNGAPDGFALDVSGDVRQFVSYEGRFAATAGPAAGRMSIEVPFSESEGTPVGASIGMTGLGREVNEFVWNSSSISTPGFFNTGQSISAVPEPGSYALVAGLMLGGFAWWRRSGMARRAVHP